MSWSISTLGSPRAVLAAVDAATAPTSEPEKAQFEAARALIRTMVDGSPSSGVQVEASGWCNTTSRRCVVAVESKDFASEPAPEPAPTEPAVAAAPAHPEPVTSAATPAAKESTTAKP